MNFSNCYRFYNHPKCLFEHVRLNDNNNSQMHLRQNKAYMENEYIHLLIGSNLQKPTYRYKYLFPKKLRIVECHRRKMPHRR